MVVQQLKSPKMALADYNGGPENVQRCLSRSPDVELFDSDFRFVETRQYVTAVFAARAAYSSLP